MNSTIKKYLMFFGFAILLILLLDYNKPKPINWTPTFFIEDKIPFGMYILNQQMDSLVKDQKVNRFHKSIYEFINDTVQYNSSKQKTLLLIENKSSIEHLDVAQVLNFVAKGNTIFAISNFLPNNLTDTLNLHEYAFSDAEKPIVWTSNQHLNRQQFNLAGAYSLNHFISIDTVNNTVLGYQNSRENPRVPNFIKVPFGKGFFFFNTQPKAFTNYSLLESNNHLYVENVLSYLPNQPIYWKVHKKTNEEAEVISSSPLRFILQNPALKWAWYTILLGLVIFVVFTAKRKQRSIPILHPLKNTTVEFTKTIGNLYLMSEDYPDLTDKIIVYALAKIRRVYLIDTHKLDDHFVQTLHKMTNKDIEKIKNWVTMIHSHQTNPTASTQTTAVALHTLTEEILN